MRTIFFALFILGTINPANAIDNDRLFKSFQTDYCKLGGAFEDLTKICNDSKSPKDLKDKLQASVQRCINTPDNEAYTWGGQDPEAMANVYAICGDGVRLKIEAAVDAYFTGASRGAQIEGSCKPATVPMSHGAGTR